nr:unnamed protein product [Callosobruchus analis]
MKSKFVNFDVNNARKVNPRPIIKNLGRADLEDDDSFLKTVASLNDLEDCSGLKLITKLKRRDEYDLVLEAPLVHKMFTNRGYIHLTWKRCSVFNHTHIVQCYRCSSFGHLSKNCKNEPSWFKCSETHEARNCSSNEPNCINCIEHNKKSGQSLATNQQANYYKCDMYQNYVSTLLTSIKFGHLNVRSILSDFDEIVTMVCADDYIFAVSETWLSKNISSDVVKIKYLWVKTSLSRHEIVICVLYTPPSSNLNECFSVFNDMIPFYLSQFNNIIILGDINVNMLLPHNAAVPFFNNYGFTQLVSSPTRITDLTSSLLDPIFVNQPLLIKSCYTLDSAGVPDHKIVAFDYEVLASTRRQKFVIVLVEKGSEHVVRSNSFGNVTERVDGGSPDGLLVRFQQLKLSTHYHEGLIDLSLSTHAIGSIDKYSPHEG